MSDSSQEDPRSSRSPRAPRRSRREVEQRRKKVRGWFLKIGVAIFGLGVCAFAFSILQKDRILQYLDRRASDELLQEARGAAGRDDIDGARALAMKALEKDQRNTEALRLMASLERDLAGAEAILGVLAAAGVASVEERIRLLELHLLMGRIEDAKLLAEDLQEVVPEEDALFLTLLAKLRLKQKDRKEAEALLDRARALDPDLAQARLLYAQFQLESPITDLKDVGWETIFGVAEADTEGIAGLEALRNIRDSREVLLVPTEKYFELYKEHPFRRVDVDPTPPLIAWELDLYPERRVALAKAAIETWVAAGMEKEELDDRLRWLSEHGGNEAVSAYLAAQPVDEEGTLVPARLTALLDDGDREGVIRLIEELRMNPEQEAYSYLCEAVAMIRWNRPGEEVRTVLVDGLNRSGAVGETRAAFFVGLGRAAMSQGFVELAREAFFGAMEEDARWAHLELMQLEQELENFEPFLEHLEALLAFDPANPALRLYTSYVQLLLGIHRDAARESAARLLALDRDNPQRQLVAAFAHHAFDEHEEALALARGIDPSRLSDPRRPVLVAIFREAGEEEEAAAIAATIDRSELSPPEAALLEGE